MDTSGLKLVLTSQTSLGVFQVFVVLFGGVPALSSLLYYHAKDEFSCSPKPDSSTREHCYDKYTSTMSPWLIPGDVLVAITFGVLCVCWVCYSVYSAGKIRQIKRDREAEPNQGQTQWRTLRCRYIIHVVFRLVFLVGMIGVFCGSQTLDLPSVFECSPRTPQTNKTAISVHQTESKIQCKDSHYKEKSILNILILVIEALVMTLGISELLQLTLTNKPFQEMLLGNVLEVANNLDMENLLAKENKLSGETKNIERSIYHANE